MLKVITHTNSLSQINFDDIDISDIKSIAKLKVGNLVNIDFMGIILTTKIDKSRIRKKKDQKFKQVNMVQ